MALSLHRTALAGGLAAVALTATGCGTDKTTQNNEAQIRQVVTQFAASAGPRACSLMTDDGLQRVYGGFTDPVAKSKANCLAASKHFKGAKVKVTQINFQSSTQAKAGATNPAGTIGYTVTLRKNGGKRWRIDQITQAKVKQ